MKTQNIPFFSRTFLVSFLFMLLTSVSFNAMAQTAQDNYQKGLEAFSRDDYSTAVEYYTKAANQGYAHAQWKLGNRYSDGKGVSEDKIKASYWYEKAFLGFEKLANQGSSDAQVILGDAYANSWFGLEKDRDKAFFWYLKAANQGHIDAQVILGNAYANSWFGLEKDRDKAFFWYLKAANQSNAEAQRELGYCFQHGLGIVEDRNKASYWFKEAASGFEKLANEGDSLAMFDIALCYHYGRGVPEDYNKAIYWYKKNGSTTALESIVKIEAEMNKSMTHASSGSSSGSTKTAAATRTISAETHYADALEYIRTNEPELAVIPLQMAVQMGHTNAMVSLGDCLRSIGQRDYRYVLNLAMMSGNMDGVQMAQGYLTQAIQKAITYYQQAADLGNPYGQQRLIVTYGGKCHK